VTETARYLAGLLAADTANHTVGIFMTDTYGAATKFITALRDWQFADDMEQASTKKATRLTIHFSNVSFVGPDALASRLKQAGTYNTPTGAKGYGDGVLVSQVVPNYNSDGSDGVKSYMRLVAAQSAAPSFTSLEGYLASRVFIAGLGANSGAVNPENLIAAFEKLAPLNIGFGATAGFSAGDHSYSKSVWGTAINADGTFDNRFYWSEGSTIQVYE